MICTNQKIFWDILKLNERSEQDGPFSWDMIFFEDIKMTMYSLDIIDSIIKSPAYENFTYESNLRFNWVQRFLEHGGFEHILSQLKRALNLSQESLQQENHISETSNLAKKFIDQMLRLMKTFMFAVIYADSKPAEQDNLLMLKRQSSKIQEQQQNEAQKAAEEQSKK